MAPILEKKWIIPNLLPVGLTVLVSPVRSGKSWLATHVALAIASGGLVLHHIPVDQGSVLYLSLDDNKQRFEDRCACLTKGHPIPDALTLETEYSTIGCGAKERLREYLLGHSDARLIVVDSYRKIRRLVEHQIEDDRDGYNDDFEDSRSLRDIALDFGIAILLVHHAGKNSNPEIGGMMGLAANCDAMMALERTRGCPQATLHISSADEIEQNFMLNGNYQLSA